MVETVNVLVEGGAATPGAPLGPVLGPMGVNIPQIVKAINEKTKAFAGMKVPVTLKIDPKTKEFEVSVGTPPTSALIVKELGIEKGSGATSTDKVGNLTLAQLIKIAEMKKDSTLGTRLKDRVQEIAGTCVSMGVTIEGLPPKDFQSQIKEGKFDKELLK